MQENHTKTPDDQNTQRKYPVRNKIINGLLICILVPGFVAFMFLGNFIRFRLYEGLYFNISVNLIIIATYFILQTIFAIINNHYLIPKYKKQSTQLPQVGIQIIGREEEPQIFISMLNRVKNLRYPKHLIKSTILCIDGSQEEQGTNKMARIFSQFFPQPTILHLTERFSQLSEEEKIETIKRNKGKFMVITQPHGGRRQVKYTAFSFSTVDTEYVFHCDSDSLINEDSLYEMAKTASGYNQAHPDKNPCGGVVGEIKINNCFNYLALHMQISYWYAFNAGRAAQSLFKCVTTISGALGFFHSATLAPTLNDYQSQKFCGIKCIYGEDRHLTSGLIESQSPVLYDINAWAMTKTPLEPLSLFLQQIRWFKGFYRETFIFLPKIFNYHVWSVMNLAYAFFIPFIIFITLAYALIEIESLAFLIIYIFVATFLMSLRGIVRTCKLYWIHSLLHPLFYLLIFLPLKIVALFSCFCEDSYTRDKKWKVAVPVGLWILIGVLIFVGIGIILNVVVEEQRLNNWMMIGVFIVCVSLLCLILHWLFWGINVFVPRNQRELQEMLYDETGTETTNQPESVETLKKSGEL